MTTIKTQLGTVTGIAGRGASAFLGIPYAAPPVGDLRWQKPVTAADWDGTLDATQFPNRSLQPPYPEALNFGGIPGDEDEDCLYLNIYTPAADGERRPVMFWIHGGAYIQGSANEYDGSILARENDVVVITINYRLGIFGYMDLSRFGEQYAGSASLGFQDQIAALRWVQDNISDYGGDPDNVTIWGESAGGGSVLALIAAPDADDLFHKAIAFSPGEIAGAPADNTAGLASHLGVEVDELLPKLQALSAADLFALQLGGHFTASTGVDGTVVTRSTTEAIKERGAEGIPLITGCTQDEGTYLAAAVDGAPGMLEMMTGIFAMGITGGVPERYIEFLEKTLPDATPLKRMERTWFDFFRASVLRTAQASADAGAGGWVYNFNVPTDNPLGVTHASEIPFTFNAFKDGAAGIAFHDGTDPAIRNLADSWSSTFVAFAHTGSPNGAGLPDWPQYTSENRACLIADLPPRIEQDPDGAEMRAIYKAI